MSTRQKKPQCRAKTRYPDRASAALAAAAVRAQDSTVTRVEVIDCTKCTRFHLRVSR